MSNREKLNLRNICRRNTWGRNRAYTLLEIMIVVSLIGLLACMALPRFIKARKQSQGRRIVHDVRTMDGAINQWALECGKQEGDPVDTAQVSTYMKSSWSPTDRLGNPYVVGAVGTNQLQISSATKTALDGVGIDWGSY